MTMTQQLIQSDDSARQGVVRDALDRLAQQLENTVPPHLVLSTVCKTLGQTLRVPQVGIALRRSDDDDFEMVTQHRNEEFTRGKAVGHPRSVRYPIIYRSETIGQLVVVPNATNPPFSPDEERLIGEIARRAGGAAHVVRITRDL